MKPAGRAWVIGGAAVAAWAVLGYFFDASPHLGWVPNWAVIISVAAPLAFIAIYTVLGILGPGKWWQTSLGINMVWMKGALVATNGILAWAVLFNHGLINSPGVAWAYVGGLLAGAAIICWRSVIWIRGWRKESPLLTRIHELEAEVAALRARES